MPGKWLRRWLAEDLRHGLAAEAHRSGDRSVRDPAREQHAPTRREDAGHLARGRLRVGSEDRSEDRDHDVGGRIEKRNRGRLADFEFGLENALGRPRRRDVEQTLRWVDARDARATLGREQGGVPGPAADVHDPLPPERLGALDDDLRGGDQLLGDPLVATLSPLHRAGTLLRHVCAAPTLPLRRWTEFATSRSSPTSITASRRSPTASSS